MNISIDQFSARLHATFSSFRKLDENFPVGGIAPEPRGTHLHYAFDDEVLFLEALYPTADTFVSNTHGKRKKFLARGHGDAKYELLPTIFRHPKEGEAHEVRQYNGFLNGYISGVNIGYETSVFASFLSGVNNSSALLSKESIALLQTYENFAATDASNILGPQGQHFNVSNFPNENLLHDLSIA